MHATEVGLLVGNFVGGVAGCVFGLRQCAAWAESRLLYHPQERSPSGEAKSLLELCFEGVVNAALGLGRGQPIADPQENSSMHTAERWTSALGMLRGRRCPDRQTSPQASAKLGPWASQPASTWPGRMLVPCWTDSFGDSFA